MFAFQPPRPLNLAHRGARQVAPENTLAAFRAAMDIPGCDGVELDVLLSADGQIVVIHDFTLDKTTDGRGLVGAKTLAELKQLDAGSWKDKRFAGERIPTLEEALDVLGERAIINIELKNRMAHQTGLEVRVVELVQQRRLEQRVILSSFDPLAIWRVKRLAPSLVTGLLYAPDMPIFLRRAWLRPLAHPDALHPHHSLVSRGWMRWAKARGYQVNAWTVNELDEMHRMANFGVDAIITDQPEVLAELLNTK